MANRGFASTISLKLSAIRGGTEWYFPIYPLFRYLDEQIENHKAALLDIHLEGGAVVDAVIHIPGHCTVQMALAGMLR